MNVVCRYTALKISQFTQHSMAKEQCNSPRRPVIWVLFAVFAIIIRSKALAAFFKPETALYASWYIFFLILDYNFYI